MERSRNILLLSENETEAKRTEKTLQKWGWNHITVCIGYSEILRRLKNNPFSYAMVVIEKIYKPDVEEKVLRIILKAHPRTPIIIRSEVGETCELVGRVTYLRADRHDFNDLIDAMEQIYRDERMGHESHIPVSRWKRKPKATKGPKILPFKKRRD